MNEVKVELVTLPVASTGVADARFEDGGGSVRLWSTYWTEDEEKAFRFEFDRVRAYRHRAESHCTVWHLDAYDTLVEVENSAWVAELLEAMPEDMRSLFEMHHYMIYLDSSGCYEVVAASWRFLPEVELPEVEAAGGA